MHIDWWTLGLQTVNVLVLIWILGRFLFRPVSEMIAARQAAAGQALAEARAARDEADAEVAKAKEETARIAASRTGVMEKAAADALSERESLLASARAEADALRAAAKAEIEQAREGEERAEADRASRLAVDIAARLFEKLPPESRVAAFIGGLAEGLAALPEAARAGIGQNGAPVGLKAARELTEAEADACRGALSTVLGRPVEIAVEVDPGLIAGLEIATPHAEVRNSFGADLDRIAAELMRHDR